MVKQPVSIVFFGSGPVAAKSLELLAKEFKIEAVITKPKAPHFKGTPPTIETSEALKMPYYTASSRKELDNLFSQASFTSKIAVLIDFGIIVSQQVIDYFPHGIVNSHFSLLPQWRGADPITFSILSGQKTTGISLMLLVRGMDEGPLLAQAPYDIPHDFTTPQLTDVLIELSFETLKALLPEYLNGHITAAPQEQATLASSTQPTYSRKLSKDDGIIDWHKSAEVIEREIRAFDGWPKSRTSIAGKDIIVTKAHVVDMTGTPGGHDLINKELAIYCGAQAIAIDRLIPAGKKEMTIEAFLAGYGHLINKQ